MLIRKELAESKGIGEDSGAPNVIVVGAGGAECQGVKSRRSKEKRGKTQRESNRIQNSTFKGLAYFHPPSQLIQNRR